MNSSSHPSSQLYSPSTSKAYAPHFFHPCFHHLTLHFNLYFPYSFPTPFLSSLSSHIPPQPQCIPDTSAFHHHPTHNSYHPTLPSPSSPTMLPHHNLPICSLLLPPTYSYSLHTPTLTLCTLSHNYSLLPT